MPEQTSMQVLDSFPPFAGAIEDQYRASLAQPGTFQMNIGYKCNLSCKHCHLNCSPARTEEMTLQTMQACLDAYESGGFSILDITGGAPEMNPHLEWLLRQAHERKIPSIVRTNLCILIDSEYRHFIDVYEECDVHLYASLPYYSARNCDKIRGDGVFADDIEAMRLLNAVGFGTGKHDITLVFSPSGPMLPPDAAELEREYHKRLEEDFGIFFTDLVVMTNMPCGRFADALNRKGKLGNYVSKLINAFNPTTVPSMMCRDQVSIDWEGRIYDCDFNQAMGVPTPARDTVFDWVGRTPTPRQIAFRNWCYACTAGAGSS